MMSEKLKKWIAPREFYHKVFKISIPFAFQQLLNSAMGIADSMMVSWIGQVTAVGTAAQIGNLMMTMGYGICSGAGIFMSQFFGKKDELSQKKSFGLGVIVCLCNALLWMTVSLLFGRQLMGFYIQDPVVIDSALQYLQIALLSYIPGVLTTMFSYAYRCIQKTHVPLVIGIISMAANVGLNYCMIFGHLGFPAMGVRGAALATLVAQTFGIILHIVYAKATKQVFMGTLKEMFVMEKDFYMPILRRAYPLVINELFFGFGSTLYIRAFGQLGKNAMDAYYVGNQISDMFFFIVQGMNSANAAILGASLGSGDLDLAKRQGNWFITLSFMMSAVSSVLILTAARPMVDMFGLQNLDVINEAVLIVRIFSIRISLRMFNVLVFSALRAGGDSKFLAFLDAGILWLVGLPMAFFLVEGLHFTSIALVFLLIQVEQVVRMTVGLRRYFKGTWLVDLTKEVKTA